MENVLASAGNERNEKMKKGKRKENKHCGPAVFLNYDVSLHEQDSCVCPCVRMCAPVYVSLVGQEAALKKKKKETREVLVPLTVSCVRTLSRSSRETKRETPTN